jgi:hypothetical protein
MAAITFFIVWFFRNPERSFRDEEKLVISPADGKVIKIESVDMKGTIAGKFKKISIFMNVLSVHVNRAPYSGKIEKINAKIDTGADGSSIDRVLAEELGLLEPDNILYHDYFRNALGRKKREIVGVMFVMAGRKIRTKISIADRSKLRNKMIVGRRDLKTFAVVV